MSIQLARRKLCGGTVTYKLPYSKDFTKIRNCNVICWSDILFPWFHLSKGGMKKKPGQNYLRRTLE